ncbi:phosphatidylserine decarboxylase [Faunimonas pinastri]|uniref:Phosphatidylserine decarboxylase proenzyme n=1 Tax=Faunimonas pinastri TaxID=1855383 RepID=A0A1H9J9R7_9HYPH|nr:phosphatidylserine decarboxylase [Faunimonas pinastri]SEQ83751.1 phosphatidylserine decarboxylase [Faunimonas pinastri]
MLLPHSITDAVPYIHREGRLFIAISLIAAILLGLLWSPLFWILIILTGWMCIFFRDPVRVTPLASDIVVSPADGRVEPIVEAVPPPELWMGPEPRVRISVFMNVFDCHINRAPVGGYVLRRAYKPGKFLSADFDKASEANERNGLVIELPNGERIGVVQIAGLVARRILCWSKQGENLEQGARFGMIRFGSRLDVYLPPGAEVAVHEGQRAVAGETILARLTDGSPITAEFLETRAARLPVRID